MKKGKQNYHFCYEQIILFLIKFRKEEKKLIRNFSKKNIKLKEHKQFEQKFI
jgi:hypothetical protein